MPAFNPPLPFTRPWLPELRLIVKRLESSWQNGVVTKGSLTAAYEKETAAYLGVQQAIAVSSCTTGLILSLRALQLTGECLVAGFTFTSTLQALLWNHLKPILVDCHPKRFTVGVSELSAAFTRNVSCVLIPYVFGNPPPLDEIETYCKANQLALIVDAAHAFGSTYHGKPPGCQGTAQVFSTSATKLLCTGEGGLIVSKDASLATLLRSLREYGHGADYEAIGQGLNGRMTEFQAALGVESLPTVEKHAVRRNELARFYRESLKDLPLSFQEIEPDCRSSYKDFAVLLEDGWVLTRDELAVLLEKEGIPARKYFYPPLHRQHFFKPFIQGANFLPNTEKICKSILCLPMYYDLAPAQIGKVAEVFENIFQNQRALAQAVRA